MSTKKNLKRTNEGDRDVEKIKRRKKNENVEEINLIDLVNKKDLEGVRLLLKKEKDGDFNINQKDKDNALIIASRLGTTEIVELLLKNEANPNENYFNMTALMTAAAYGRLEEVKLLLKYGADKNKVFNNKDTALMLANANWISLKEENPLKKNYFSIIQLLKKNEELIKPSYKKLLEASRDGNLKKVIKYFESSIFDINQKDTSEDSTGDTALGYACKYGHLEIVKFLVEKGADINQKNDFGKTPLMYASARGHLEIVELLLKNKADINKKNSKDMTALMYASLHEYPKIVKLLIEKGASINNKDNNKFNAFMLANKNTHSSNKADLILIQKSLKGRENLLKKNFKELLEASKNGNLKKVELLLKENNVDINEKDSIGDSIGNTALMEACEYGHLEIVKLLIEKGADVNLDNNFGITALMYASKKGYLKIIELLLKNDADINYQDNYGKNSAYTALIYACKEGQLETVKLLLKKGANINEKDVSNETALLIACSSGHLEIVKLLLKNGADMNQVDKFGFNSLMMATKAGKLEIVKFLVENGADVKYKNKTGDTALTLAYDNRRDEESSSFEEGESSSKIVDFLLDNGADKS